MKRIIFLMLFLVAVNINTFSQVYYTKNGSISFFSKSVLQDIQADNNQVISVFNVQSGAIQFSLLNNAFHFPKAKMEEDFNQNYIESDKYPRSSFNGTVTNVHDITVNKDGTYAVTVKGDLTIHGITKNIVTPATITINNGNISAAASFHVLVKDYKINIPTIVSEKIAENIEVKVICSYQKK